MSTLEEAFKKSLEDIQSKNPCNDKKLKLYGLFKQIYAGDNKDIKPWSYQIEKSYKWQAWKDNTGRCKKDCMKDYIEIVNSI